MNDAADAIKYGFGSRGLDQQQQVSTLLADVEPATTAVSLDRVNGSEAGRVPSSGGRGSRRSPDQ